MRFSSSSLSGLPRGRPKPRLFQQPSEQATQFRCAKERPSQLRHVLLVQDQRRALKTTAVVVVTETDLVGPLRFTFEEVQELNRGDMIGRRDLYFFFNHTAPPVERKRLGCRLGDASRLRCHDSTSPLRSGLRRLER